MSSLQALNGFKLELDHSTDLKNYSYLTAIGKTVVLCCIPSHVNMPGNEKLTMQQNPHYLFLSLTWDFPPMIWLLMFQSFAWKNGRTCRMPVKAINFTLFIPTLVATSINPVMSGCCTNQQTLYWSYSTCTLLSIVRGWSTSMFCLSVPTHC